MCVYSRVVCICVKVSVPPCGRTWEMGALVPPIPNHATVYPFRIPLVGLSAQDHKLIYLVPFFEVAEHPIRVFIGYF